MFVRNAPLIIDPLNLSKTHQEQLIALISQRPLLRYFAKDFQYIYERKTVFARYARQSYLQLTSALIRIQTKSGTTLGVVAEEFELAQGVHAFLLRGYLHQDENLIRFQGLNHHYYIHCDKPIQLLRMTEKQSQFLFALMMQASKEDHTLRQFRQGCTLFYLKDENHHYYTVHLNIDSDVLMRRRESNAEEIRFELSANHASFLGCGGLGRVYRTHATLIPLSNGALKLKPHQRVIKEMIKWSETSRDSLQHEYRMSALTPHLHPKHIIRQVGEDPKLWMVSRYLPGLNLQDYLNELKGEPVMLDGIRHLVDLSYELLRCVYEQGFKLGIIHCDIKPSNLQLDISNKKYPQLNLLDYGLSRNSRCKIMKCGTNVYAAPEVWNIKSPINATYSMDVYSAGVTLIKIWDILEMGKLYNQRRDTKIVADESIRMALISNMCMKYSNISLVTVSMCEALISIIFGMICEPPESRMTVELAMSQMAQFRHLFYSNYYSVRDRKKFTDYYQSLLPAYTYAEALCKSLPALLRSDTIRNEMTATLAGCGKMFTYLQDDVAVIENFLFMLGERCLQAQHDKEGVKNKLVNIANNYLLVKGRHLAMIAQLKDLSHFDEFASLSGEYQSHLCCLYNSCAAHAALLPEKLDEVVTLTDILERDIQKLVEDVDFLQSANWCELKGAAPVRPWRQNYAPLTLGDLCQRSASGIKNIDIKI